MSPIGRKGELEQAFASLSRDLRADPSRAETRARLDEVATELGAWDRLAALYEEAADQTGSIEVTTALLTAVAGARIQQKQPQKAVATYRRILGIRPDDVATRERLEEVCRQHEGWVELAASLEERTDPRLGAALKPQAAAPLLRELAHIYADRLSKPRDAVGCLERLREMVPRDKAALEQLIPLYESLGRWKNAIEALTQLSRESEGSERAREALRRTGEIYLNELELSDRALEVYRLMVTRWPNDQTALATYEDLLEKTGQWAELSELLKRRISVTQDTGQRVALLRKRAHILLDRLNRPDEAAACLRTASIGQEDAGPEDQLLEALSRAGRHREVAATLQGRIGTLAQTPPRGGGDDPAVALMVQLASLQLKELHDAVAARRTLQKALERTPSHAGVLAMMVEVVREHGDPHEHADLLLRRADHEPDVGMRIATLLEAGALFRDKLENAEAARAALLRAYELDPGHPGAARQLAALVADEDPDLALKTLETILPRVTGEERLAVLLEMADMARRVGPAHVAEARLDEILEEQPENLAAIRAMTDLLYGEERYLELITLVRESLERVAVFPADVRVELLRRSARAYEAMGDDEKAFANLSEADRLHRNDLLTKLAMGRNRQRRGHLREAALILAGLENHPDAKKHAVEVAAGLCVAADAEAQARRTSRGPALYEAALRLDPMCAPALHALAEQEMERGNVARAAELLTRQAEASEDAADRLRLFDALGDLYLESFGDEEKAQACYESAIAAADPVDDRHEALLEKLYACQRSQGDLLAAAGTAELLAGLPGAPPRRWLDVASNAAAAGEGARARAAAEKALELDPLDEDVVWVASEIQLADGDHEAAASSLGRALGAWATVERKEGRAELEDTARRRRAELLCRLGDARRARGDVRGATTAYERSLETDALCTGSRRGMLALSDGLEARLIHLGPLVEAEARPEEALELARTLALGPGEPVATRLIFELAAALGARLVDEDRRRIAKLEEHTLGAVETYRGTVEDEDRAALISDPGDAPLAAILAAAWDAAPYLWPDPARALEALEVADTERTRGVSRGAAAAIYPQIVKALRGPVTVVYTTRDPRHPDVRVVCASPPIILLGPRLINPTLVDAETNARMRFLLGRAVELARPERVAAAGLPRPLFARLVAGLTRAFGKLDPVPIGGVAEDEAEAEAQRLRKTIPVPVRLRLEGLFAGAALERLDPVAYRAACERAADRSGLIISGHLGTAMHGSENPRHLLELAAKDRFRLVVSRL